jgi:hypothetical protein
LERAGTTATRSKMVGKVVRRQGVELMAPGSLSRAIGGRTLPRGRVRRAKRYKTRPVGPAHIGTYSRRRGRLLKLRRSR